MQEQESRMLKVLQLNRGFTHPEKWIEYGITHKFETTKAEKFEKCPDCSTQSFGFIGQFVYYSTLVNLLECYHCGLVFTDTRIDSEVISAHFEHAYKDEEYFAHRRHRIFQQIARIADEAVQAGGRVLDIGGAKGHLLAVLKIRRPDLHFVLNDISKDACDHAKSRYGFQTIVGGINKLEEASSRFDLIILSDVIYYESELRRLWNVLPRLVSEKGTIIIRVPNKLALIRSWQLLNRTITRSANSEMQDNIRFFNPEHLFVFSRQYLSMRLKNIGFERVFSKPSELLVNGRNDWMHPLLYYVCKAISILSFEKIIITPSLLVIAKRTVST